MAVDIVSRYEEDAIFSPESPEFLQQPANITSYEGQIAQFPCLVNPNLHARVTWLKNRRPFVMAEAQESRMLILPSGMSL